MLKKTAIALAALLTLTPALQTAYTSEVNIHPSLILGEDVQVVTHTNYTDFEHYANNYGDALFDENSLFTGVRQTDYDFRGVWVTTVINLDFPSRAGLSNDEIKAEIRTIVERSAAIGLNAIILQVRPEGDAIYPSDIFPWSRYITGTQGQAPADGFDPLGYFLYRTHEAGLELHAWINPYRVTHATTRITNVNELATNNPARLNPHLVREWGNRLYLDPGFPESRQLILDGITELLARYDLDGIHFDDYFYPRQDFDDAVSFARYGAGRSLQDFRRDNVNLLVYEVHSLIQSIDPNIRFGISPTGIWANYPDHPQGSATRGFQHLTELSADSLYWVYRGWIDYIIPQLYWHRGFAVADYNVLLPWWEAVARESGVALHIGHAAWREHDGHEHWHRGEILEQLRLNHASDVVQGSVFFRFNHIRGYVGDDIAYFYRYHATQLPADEWVASRSSLDEG